MHRSGSAAAKLRGRRRAGHLKNTKYVCFPICDCDGNGMAQRSCRRDGLRNYCLNLRSRERAGGCCGLRRRRDRSGRGNRTGIVRRSVAYVTDADAHAIAGDALKSYSHQHVADVLHLIVETHDDRTHPSLVRNGTHIFNRQLIKVMSAVFGCRRDCRSIRLRVQLLREKHDASAIVGAPAHR